MPENACIKRRREWPRVKRGTVSASWKKQRQQMTIIAVGREETSDNGVSSPEKEREKTTVPREFGTYKTRPIMRFELSRSATRGVWWKWRPFNTRSNDETFCQRRRGDWIIHATPRRTVRQTFVVVTTHESSPWSALVRSARWVFPGGERTTKTPWSYGREQQ